MRILLFIGLLLSYSVSQANPASLDHRVQLSDSTLSIVGYNVENLFDTEHDAGKQDWEFLPSRNANGSPNQIKVEGCQKTSNAKRCLEVDWTVDRLQLKLQQIAEVMRLQGDLPDVLVLSEIENRNVTSLLASVLGYNTNHLMITTGNDERGINVAILYRDRLLDLDSQDVESVKDERGQILTTRQIIVANFKVKGTNEILGVVGNHWPSQGNDVKDRIAAAKTMNALIDRQRKKYGNSYKVVAAGDFNVIQYDRPHPIIEVVEARENGLRDALMVLKKNNEGLFYKLPTGSYYFTHGTTWDYLDKILVSQNLLGNESLSLNKNSFRIMGFPEVSKAFDVRNPDRHANGNLLQKIPKRYDHRAQTPQAAGYSDHYPVRILLEIRPK